MPYTELDRVEEVLRQFDAQGWHRTATGVDDESARWLAGLIAGCGVRPGLEPFELDRVDPVAAFVEARGRRVEGMSLFDCTFTDASGVSGPLGAAGGEAPIGLTSSQPLGVGHNPLRELRRGARHRAIVVATRGGRPGIAALNAVDFLAPYGPPVLLVAGEELPWLEELAQSGETVRVVAQSQRTAATAQNVTALVAGSEPALAPLGIVTPRSGWWGCASERGGGLVCWLAILERLQQAVPVRSVQLVATSGHELDFLGFERYLERHPAAAAGAHAWIHLGANIGARDPDRGTLRAGSESLQQLALNCLERAGAGPYAVTPPGPALTGEARDISSRGGSFVSMVGGNAYFHLEADHYPEAVNPESVRRYAAAFADMALTLAADSSTVLG